MQAVSSIFLQAIRQPHAVAVTVDAWRAGSKVASDLPVEGGEVTVDSGSRVRRKLDLTLAPEPGLWDLLVPGGTELVVRRGIRYPSGTTETAPCGTFPIDVQEMSYSQGRLSLTAPDRWVRVQRARFETPNTEIAGQRIAAEMARYITEAVPGITVDVRTAHGAHVIPVTWERDRDEALKFMAQAIACESFFGADGNAVVQDVPTLNQPSVWLVDASATGVLLEAGRERNRQRTYNVVVVASEQVDGQAPFPPVIVEDTDSTSPTWVGGTFGRVPYFFTSPLLRSQASAQTAGQTILDRVRGMAAQLTLTSIANPALDVGDVIDVLLPPERRDLPRPVERHIIDSLTIPLTIDGSQSISTRSTRPDSDSGGG